MSAMSQREAILAWLQDGGTLTHRECQRFGWGDRLAARIDELRKEYGHDAIISTTETNNGKRWTRYSWAHGEQLDLLSA